MSEHHIRAARESAQRHRKLPALFRLLAIDVTLAIAVTGGLLTINGYAHLEKFYNTLDIPLARLNLSTQVLLSYGGAGLGTAFMLFFLIAALLGGITVLLGLLEKPGRVHSASEVTGIRARVRARVKELDFDLRWAGILVCVALLVFAVWKAVLRDPSESGRRAAISVIKHCTEETLFYQGETRTGCVITESDDMFYLIKRLNVSDTHVSFNSFRLPKAGFLKSQGDTQTLNVKED
ncbi:hypothetical protein [Pseudomonas sp. KNUC1026]|uniref:hypothetical protein n=1 Tax=Pseudomonas sp. KNUC1026 TaxID=2893890 RepID=UPI001F23959C|nr:hypothetical protein [Pseudomonas sp. KNUC1026]UFH50434.1 hypothetical protein LN139_04085 [Pseudomonas sp. KNUC1026]